MTLDTLSPRARILVLERDLELALERATRAEAAVEVQMGRVAQFRGELGRCKVAMRESLRAKTCREAMTILRNALGEQ